MNRKMLTPILALGLILCLMAPGANAWEFSMDGTFTWLYEVRGQLGNNGFFGKYDQAAAPGVTPNNPDGTASWNTVGAFAPYNFYVGGYYVGQTPWANTVSGPNATTGTQIYSAYGGRPYAVGQIVSGSDASWNTMFMLANMQVRMNPAVRIRGSYYIGGWESPNYSVSRGSLVAYEYMNMEAHGIQRSFSPGYWRTLWLTAQLPWGEIAVGKRPSSWGMGLAFNGTDNRSSESVALAAPFGPFRVQLSFYPSRQGYMPDDYNTITTQTTTEPATSPRSGNYYNPRPDKNNTRVFDMTVPNVTYACGPISAGVYANWMFRHRGGESRIEAPADRYERPTLDYSEWYGGAFFKFNNGRFFLNSEFQTLQATTRNSYNMAGDAVFRVIPPAYTEHLSGAVEAGVLAGPSKVSVIGAWFTGDDRRWSPTAARPNGAQVTVKSGRQPDSWSNTGVFRPYSYLMVYSYGLGQSFARDTGNGYVSDASIYAARLDYAVAANLNLFGSFMWAERFSNSGYLWGTLKPAVNNAPDFIPQGQVALQSRATHGSIEASVPTIPDGALGYEIDAGFDWKLLEDLTARCTLGYWVPGKWWSYATIDKSHTNWGIQSGRNWDNNWFTRPDKTIDPIWGMEFKLEGTF